MESSLESLEPVLLLLFAIAEHSSWSSFSQIIDASARASVKSWSKYAFMPTLFPRVLNSEHFAMTMDPLIGELRFSMSNLVISFSLKTK